MEPPRSRAVVLWFCPRKLFTAPPVCSPIHRQKARLQALRGGDNEKPFTIHIPHRQSALHYLGEVGKLGDRLMKKLWPGPVGLMFEVPADRRAEVAANFGLRENDLYDSGNITLRCPDNLVTADVLSEVDGPVVLTIASADAGGPNLKIENLAKELDGKVEMIFDTGPTSYSKPSTLLKITGEKYEIVRAGVYDERIIDRLLKTTILFVCSGNTCRSPMAEAIARKVLADKLHIEEADLDKAGMTVVSAGSYAMPGVTSDSRSGRCAPGDDIDLSRHRSKPLTVELIHQADAIYTMGRSHLNAVRSLVPSASDKVQTLKSRW